MFFLHIHVSVSAVDHVEFSIDIFSPYLETMFQLLMKLLTDVESCDSKVRSRQLQII